jgi:hypothetical protein
VTVRVDSPAVRLKEPLNPRMWLDSPVAPAGLAAFDSICPSAGQWYRPDTPLA